MNFLDNLFINLVDNIEYLFCLFEGFSSRSVYKKVQVFMMCINVLVSSLIVIFLRNYVVVVSGGIMYCCCCLDLIFQEYENFDSLKQ